MFQGNKNDIAKFLPYVSADLQKALNYIANTDFNDVSAGEYEIDGRNIFVRVSKYTTEEKDKRRAEKHEQYIDVQYVAEGSETIWYTPLNVACQESENKAAKEDVIFYHDPHEKNYISLNAGDFAVFFPWELHRPNCANIEGDAVHLENVKKIVVKVKA